MTDDPTPRTVGDDSVPRPPAVAIVPYYEADGITLYNARCEDVLPTLPAGHADLVLTDPPYNAGKDYGDFKDALSDDDYAAWMEWVARECRRIAPKQAWVAPRYKLDLFLSLFHRPHLVVVTRGAQGPFRAGWSDQFEIVLIEGKPLRVHPDLWTDIRLKGEGYFFREETYGHPGYTPLPIMRRCAALLAAGPVLDPFAGTGTALVAAKALGLPAIGIERNPAYCEIAVQRLRQSVLRLEGIA